MVTCIRLFIVLLCVVSLSLTAKAQNGNVGNWLIYFGNQKINKKWNWHNEVQYRNFNFIGDINQLLIRTGIGYDLSENNNNVLLGYGFIQSHSYISAEHKKVINEHRIFQQFITKQRMQSFYVQHRFRMEERFFTDAVKGRFRYFLSVNKPLNKKVMETNAFYISAYNEIFLNTANTLFDRNRLYGGAGYCINKHLRFETGFMTQMLSGQNQNQFQLIFFNNIPFNNN